MSSLKKPKFEAGQKICFLNTFTKKIDWGIIYGMIFLNGEWRYFTKDFSNYTLQKDKLALEEEIYKTKEDLIAKL